MVPDPSRYIAVSMKLEGNRESLTILRLYSRYRGPDFGNSHMFRDTYNSFSAYGALEV